MDTTTKIIEADNEHMVCCPTRERYGKCVIMLPEAKLCLNCLCISTAVVCPNCLSRNSVRLVEIAFDEGDISHEALSAKIRQKLHAGH